MTDGADYDETPLTVRELRMLLADVPDDARIVVTYDGKWVSWEVAVGEVRVDRGDIAHRRHVDELTVVIDV